MNLRDYLRLNNILPATFAKKIGISKPTFDRILSGSDIKLSIAYEIENATMGAVTMEDLAKNIKHSNKNFSD